MSDGEHNNLGATYERILLNGSLHLETHVLLCAALAFAFAYQHSHPRAVWWKGGSALLLAVGATAVTWPFIYSTVTTRDLVTSHRFPLVFYLVIVSLCASVTFAAMLPDSPIHWDQTDLIVASIVQFVIIVAAKRRILGETADSK